MPDPKDLYYVAVKVFLENNGKLFIFKDKFGDWDLPGGRIRKDEFAAPLEDVIVRKMREELGDDLRYKLGNPVVFFRHERIEASSGKPVRIFGIGYTATWSGGKPKLSDIHTEMQWVDVATFKPEEYFTGGWLRGVQEYLESKA